MVLDLRKVREFVQALLRAWNQKDEGDVLENVAQTSTASDDGSNGKPVPAGTKFSSPSQPGVSTGDGAAGQSPGTLSRPANVQTIHGRPLNAVDTKKGLSDPRVYAAIFRLADGDSDMAGKAPHQEKKLPEVRSKTSSEGANPFRRSVPLRRDTHQEELAKAVTNKTAGECRHVNFVKV